MGKTILIFVCRFFIILTLGVVSSRYAPRLGVIKSWQDILDHWPLFIFLSLVATFLFCLNYPLNGKKKRKEDKNDE